MKNVIRWTTVLLFVLTCEVLVFQILSDIKILEGYGYWKQLLELLKTLCVIQTLFPLASRKKISFSSTYYIFFYALYIKCKYFDMQDMTCIFILLMNKYIFFIHMSLVLYRYIVNHASCTILFHWVGSFRLKEIYVIPCLNIYIYIISIS